MRNSTPPADRAYFEKWYRDRRHRVSTRAATARKAALAVALAEYYLGRPLRTVLDVGCGEGQWQLLLARLRPGVRYLGIDPSEYAVRRYGRRRNLRLGQFATVGEVLPARGAWDLIVCSDALYYLEAAEIAAGLATLVPRLAGVAFLEAYDAAEPLEGDLAGSRRLEAAAYRRLYRAAGLVPCGSHGYVGPALAHRVTALERGWV